jgi:hypothetical protein
MSEDIIDDSFRNASENIEKDHQQAVEALRKKVADAKTDALKKVRS